MANEIRQFLRDHGISEVEAIIPDMAGIARGKIMPAEKFAEDEGMRLPESIFLQTVTGDYPPDTDKAMSPAEIDIILKADPKTVRRVPWAAEPTAQVIHDCFYADGRRVGMAPRGVLRHILEMYAKRGWEPVVAPELEFYLVEPNIDADYPLKPPVGRSGRAEPGRQSYSIAAVNEFDPLFDDMYQFCEDQDIEIDTLIHEDGAAQMEINLLHGNALDLADQAFLFKRTAREAALRHKMYATFMAKPHAKEPGSAMHIHQSIVDTKTQQEHLLERRRHADAAVLLAHRRHAEIPAGGHGAAGAEREFLPPHLALPARAHQRAVGLRQPHGGPARAGIRPRGAPRREPPRRRRCQSLHRDRHVAGLRLPRHGRRPAAFASRSPAARTTCRSRCRARSTTRSASCASASRWCASSATRSSPRTPSSRKPNTRCSCR